MELDIDARASFEKRAQTGRRILRTAWVVAPKGDDRWSAAADAISDVLTAMIGPAGVYVYDTAQDEGTPRGYYNEDAEAEAGALLMRAFDSWRGDAEDYIATTE